MRDPAANPNEGDILMKRRGGFTLTELLAAVVLVAVLTAIAMPQYQRAVELRRRQAATDVLKAIYAGEQTFWAQSNDQSYLAVASDADDAAAQFTRIYTPLPSMRDAVTFTVTVGVDDAGDHLTGAAAKFTATAQRSNSNCALSVTNTWDPHTEAGGTWLPDGTCLAGKGI